MTGAGGKSEFQSTHYFEMFPVVNGVFFPESYTRVHISDSGARCLTLFDGRILYSLGQHEC